MHEMGIAASVLDIVCQYVTEERAPLLRVVRVRVGDLVAVQTDSLRFCFEAIVAGTPYERAALEIDCVSGRDLSVSELELDDEDDAEARQGTS